MSVNGHVCQCGTREDFGTADEAGLRCCCGPEGHPSRGDLERALSAEYTGRDAVFSKMPKGQLLALYYYLKRNRRIQDGGHPECPAWDGKERREVEAETTIFNGVRMWWDGGMTMWNGDIEDATCIREDRRKQGGAK